jgi:hypothetical protein
MQQVISKATDNYGIARTAATVLAFINVPLMKALEKL